MATKNVLSISPFGDQKEVLFFISSDDTMIIESSYNEYQVYIEIKPEDWENIKNFIDTEFKKLNENG